MLPLHLMAHAASLMSTEGGQPSQASATPARPRGSQPSAVSVPNPVGPAGPTRGRPRRVLKTWFTVPGPVPATPQTTSPPTPLRQRCHATWPCDSGEALTCLSLACSPVSVSIKRFDLSRGHSQMPFGQSSHTLRSPPALPYPYFKEIFKKRQHTWPNFTALTFSTQTFPPHSLSPFPLPPIPSPPCLPLHF